MAHTLYECQDCGYACVTASLYCPECGGRLVMDHDEALSDFINDEEDWQDFWEDSYDAIDFDQDSDPGDEN